MSFDIIKNVCFHLFTTYSVNLSKNIRDLIVSYFFNNKEDKDNSILINFAGSFPFLREMIFSKLKDYTLQKEDFFTSEENQKIKLFKGILEKIKENNKEFNNNEVYKDIEEYKNIPYISNSLSVIYQLRNELDKNEVLFKDINLFYEEEKIEEFNKRLELIYYDDNEKFKLKKEDLEKKINEINNELKDLDLIYIDLIQFFPKTEKESIDKIASIKNGIGEINLNDYKVNNEGEVQALITLFKKKAEERTKKKKVHSF